MPVEDTESTASQEEAQTQEETAQDGTVSQDEDPV